MTSDSPEAMPCDNIGCPLKLSCARFQVWKAQDQVSGQIGLAGDGSAVTFSPDEDGQCDMWVMRKELVENVLRPTFQPRTKHHRRKGGSWN